MDEYTFNLVSGTGEYPLPTDFIKMDVVTYNGQSLKKTDRGTLKKMVNGAFTSGNPYAYYITGSNIGFYPIPVGGVAGLEYFKKLPTLTEVQGSELPSEFDDAICTYASYIAFNGVNKIDKATVMRADYQDIMSTLLMSYIYDDLNVSYSYQNASYTPSDTSTYNLR